MRVMRERDTLNKQIKRRKTNLKIGKARKGKKFKKGKVGRPTKTKRDKQIENIIGQKAKQDSKGNVYVVSAKRGKYKSYGGIPKSTNRPRGGRSTFAPPMPVGGWTGLNNIQEIERQAIDRFLRRNPNERLRQQARPIPQGIQAQRDNRNNPPPIEPLLNRQRQEARIQRNNEALQREQRRNRIIQIQIEDDRRNNNLQLQDILAMNEQAERRAQYAEARLENAEEGALRYDAVELDRIAREPYLMSSSSSDYSDVSPYEESSRSSSSEGNASPYDESSSEGSDKQLPPEKEGSVRSQVSQIEQRLIEQRAGEAKKVRKTRSDKGKIHFYPSERKPRTKKK